MTIDSLKRGSEIRKSMNCINMLQEFLVNKCFSFYIKSTGGSSVWVGDLDIDTRMQLQEAFEYVLQARFKELSEEFKTL